MKSFLLLLLLIGLSTAAPAVEEFTLIDGRVIVGDYDLATKTMRAQTAAGVIVFILEPERIASRAARVSQAPPSDDATRPEAVPPTRETRGYYLRERQRLDDQLNEDWRALAKELGGGSAGPTYPLMREHLFELKREYDALGLAVRTEPDGERRKALSEQWSALDQRYNNLLMLMKQAEGERSIVRERLEMVERTYREQVALLEKAWTRDGHGQPPIQ